LLPRKPVLADGFLVHRVREIERIGPPPKKCNNQSIGAGTLVAEGATEMTTYFEVGVLLTSATLSMGTSALVSGK
jgi:hypothetical protein